MHPATKEQQNIIDVCQSESSLLIEARAGCAKTDTGVRMTIATPNDRWQFLVFGNKNAKEFQSKLPSNAQGSTFHTFCNSFIKKRYNLDKTGFKMYKIISQHEDYNFKNPKLDKTEAFAVRENLNAMKDLVALLKNSFVSPTVADVSFIIDHFGIIFSLDLQQVCEDAIEFLHDSDKITSELDFNDMVRLPIISKSIKTNKRIFLDEGQDNTPIRNEALRQFREMGCDVVVVGDKFQAIMGFAGADCNSMANIKAAINPVSMPLTVNFRCGKKIIAEAQKLVPDIRAWDNSPDGIVSYIDNDKLLSEFKPGECAVSRFNKIIIPMCFKLIKSGKKATVQGQDFGANLKSMVAGFQATDKEGFFSALEKWKDKKLAKSKSQSVTDAIEDKFDCMTYFADNSETVDQIGNTIDSIFSDKEQGDGLKLSTAHKAKGLEWPRTYILDANNFMNSHPNDKPWNTQQLRNLFYVAQTRAKQELTYVNATTV